MRKVIAGLFISLDGVVESPHLWQFDVFNEEMGAAMDAYLKRIDTVLLGRVTYEEWAGYWPAAEDVYAMFINPTPKYVVSATLGRADWQNSTIISGDTAAAITRLKEQPGREIGVQGSPTLVRHLLLVGLLDELTLMIHPVVVGSGKRLFDDHGELQRLELIDSQITATGVAFLTYRPRGMETTD